jgi:RHS repeat-associated protein
MWVKKEIACPEQRIGNETGLYYYVARYYAAWLCRFVSVDPLKDEYPYYTPYQYAGNKPITFIDLDGLEEAASPLMKSDNTNIQSSVDAKRMAFEFTKQQQKEQSQNIANLLSGTGVEPNPNTPSFSQGKTKTTSQIKEEQKKTRQIEGQQRYEQLKRDVSATSPFVGGGGNFGFGFASTTATALQETPFLIAPELLGPKVISIFRNAGKVGRAIEGSRAFKVASKPLADFSSDLITQAVADASNNLAEGNGFILKTDDLDIANAVIKGVFGRVSKSDKRLVFLEEGLKSFIDFNIEDGFILDDPRKAEDVNNFLAEYGLRLGFKFLPSPQSNGLGENKKNTILEISIESIKKYERGEFKDQLLNQQ